MIGIIILTILITITLIQCLQKWRFFDWYSAKLGHIRWLPDGSCFLCFSFWLSIPISALVVLAKSCGAEWTLIPFASAGTVNFLVTFVTILAHDRDQLK